jgi:hypothetical protein
MSEKFYMWLAWKLPRDLVKWCCYRVLSWAIMCNPDNTPDEINILKALENWEEWKDD